MKRIHSLMILSAAVLGMFALGNQALAQFDGYQFGVGYGYAHNYGRFGVGRYDRSFGGLPIAPTPRVDAPPFFALYPPVYYSQDIVHRPYGVSPYAAPPGIAPVEMVTPTPMLQVNPYYVEPKSEPESSESGEDSQTEETTDASAVQSLVTSRRPTP